MPYSPPFTLTNKMLDLSARFSELLGVWAGSGGAQLTPMLRRGNRIKTIQASLEIEQNTLTIAQVTALVEGKVVLGAPREIQEVKNALEQATSVNDGVNDEVSDGVKIKLDALDKQLLSACQKNAYITQEQLVLELGKSKSTIERRIRKLKSYCLCRIGSDKTGYWEVNK